MNHVSHRQVNPEKAHEYLSKAEIYTSANNFDAALNAVRECLKYQPSNVEAYTLAVRIYLRVLMYEEAYQLIQKILNNGNPSEQTLVLKAKTELMTKRHAECKMTLDQVFEFKREHPAGLLILADLYFHIGRYPDAIGLYERLHKIEPGNQEILYGLAQSYFKLKDYDETIFYCKQIMDTQTGMKAIEGLYRAALKELKKRILADRNNMSWIQRVYLYVKDPITDDQIKVKSITDRALKRTQQEKYQDAMTEGLNAKAMRDIVPNILFKAERECYIGLCDIDFFKFFNDQYSHTVGDIVLKILNKIGNSIFPEKFYRNGGEEFVWVFLGTEEEALAAAKDFREKIAEFGMKDTNGYIEEKRIIDPSKGNIFKVERGITVSQGISKYKQDGTNLDELLAVSDVGLKKCKGEFGRNCIVYGGNMVDQGVKPEVPKFAGRN